MFSVYDVDTTGIKVFTQLPHKDSRGGFREVWRDTLVEAHLGTKLVQSNIIHSRRGVTRGLHFNARKQGKLSYTIMGSAYIVAVDVRKGSATAGAHWGFYSSFDSGESIWIPPGFAHGLQALSETTIHGYCTDLEYGSGREYSLGVFSDVGINWPIGRQDMIYSPKDDEIATLAQFWRTVYG